jgi:hypothetical protein
MKLGDVILIRSTGLRARANLAGQFLKTGKQSAFTHVMICVGDNVVMDATLEDGVALRNVIHEVIRGDLSSDMCDKGVLMVLRPKKLNVDIAELDPKKELGQFIGLTAAQLNKKYNTAFGVSSPSDLDPYSTVAQAAFCSELVALVLKPLSVLPVGWKVASKIFPVHFERLQDAREDWLNVTPEWRGTLVRYEKQASSIDTKDGHFLAQAMNLANLSIAGMVGYRSFTDAAGQFAKKAETAERNIQEFSDVMGDLRLLMEADPAWKARIAPVLGNIVKGQGGVQKKTPPSSDPEP